MSDSATTTTMSCSGSSDFLTTPIRSANLSDINEEESPSSKWDSSQASKNDFRKLKVFEFLCSPKCMIILYVGLMVIAVGAWLLFGVIEEAVYSNDTRPDKKRIFLIEGGMIVFSSGCSATITTILIIGMLALFLAFIEAIFLVLLVKSDRDTWNIKKETLFMVGLQILGTILFLVFSQLYVFDTFIDFVWPYANILFYFSLIDMVVCVFLPVCYAIRKDIKDAKRGEFERQSYIERLLNDKKTFDILLDYGRRSYCTESILCYKDIQTFKSFRKDSNKKKTALSKIMRTMN